MEVRWRRGQQQSKRKQKRKKKKKKTKKKRKKKKKKKREKTRQWKKIHRVYRICCIFLRSITLLFHLLLHRFTFNFIDVSVLLE
jgi:hypothetical protein